MRQHTTRRGLLATAGAAVVATTVAPGAASAAPSGPRPGADVRLVKDFCAAWKHHDADALARYFAKDAVYVNAPIPGVIRGRSAIREALQVQIDAIQYTTLALKRVVSQHGVVFTERLDIFRYVGDDLDIALPIVGVFCVSADRRFISSWTDYFDLGQAQYASHFPQ